jgi:hypothetical protein
VVVREEQRLLDPGAVPTSNFLAHALTFSKTVEILVILVSPAWRFPAPAALSDGRRPASQLASCSCDSSLRGATLRKEQPEGVFSSSSDQSKRKARRVSTNVAVSTAASERKEKPEAVVRSGSGSD